MRSGSGPGWIRTSDQGIMSSLAQNAKSFSQKGLQGPVYGVDRELDSKQPIRPFTTSEIDTLGLSPELAEIVTAWPDLPENIKAAITALVQSQHTHGRE